MSIIISDKAAERIISIRKEQNKQDNILVKVGVDSGGCSGLTYSLDFLDQEPMDQQGVQYFESKGIKLLVDMRSYLYLAGTQLDYTDGLEGKGFHFENPNANRVCSCGESFSV